MSISCKIGLHRWQGCQCSKCSKTRDQDHDWQGCTCKVCAATRDEGHDWDGCTCRICGDYRDEDHAYENCTCRVCGLQQHDFGPVSCTTCGAVRPLDQCAHSLAVVVWEALDVESLSKEPQLQVCAGEDSPALRSLRRVSKQVCEHYAQETLAQLKHRVLNLLEVSIQTAFAASNDTRMAVGANTLRRSLKFFIDMEVDLGSALRPIESSDPVLSRVLGEILDLVLLESFWQQESL
jgi:hypothetical protein